MHRLSDILYDLFTGNAKGTDGCVVVLDEYGTLVDEDDVLKELEKNTVVMIIKSQNAWNPVASVSISKPQGIRFDINLINNSNYNSITSYVFHCL